MLFFTPEIPAEILFNVISFLEPIELEKCQLVNRNLRNFIDFNRHFLPIRNFEVLWISSRQNLPLLFRVHLNSITQQPLLEIQVDDDDMDQLMDNNFLRPRCVLMEDKLKMLKNIVFGKILVVDCDSAILEPFLKHSKRIVENGFKAKVCNCNARYLDVLGVEIFDNYLLVDKLELLNSSDYYIRDIFQISEESLLPKFPSKIELGEFHCREEEALDFNGIIEKADRLKIVISPHNHGDFCKSWFNMYKCQSDLSKMIGIFEFRLKKFCKFQGQSMFVNTIKFLKERKIQHTLLRENVFLYYIYPIYSGKNYQLLIKMKYNVEPFLRNDSLEETEQAGIDFNNLGFDQLERIAYCAQVL